MKLRIIVIAGLLMVGAACEENDPVSPETTTTTMSPDTTTTSFDDVPSSTTSTTRSGYVPTPLPRNGWSVEQGASFKTRLYGIVDPRIVSTQPDVMSCAVDWFISFYTPQELFEYADDELIEELSTEGIDFCGQWTKVSRQHGI